MIRLLVLTTIASAFKVSSSTITTATAIMAIQAIDFEVYGKVQGVFFRKYTKDQAKKLDLKGWCKNTRFGTVQGHIQGPPEKIETMMEWLKKTGSPSSKIEKAEFTNQKNISNYTFSNFEILKD